MDLIGDYKKYVKWCEGSGVHPIGFVNWKGKRFGYTWNKKKYIYEKDEVKVKQHLNNNRLSLYKTKHNDEININTNCTGTSNGSKLHEPRRNN